MNPGCTLPGSPSCSLYLPSLSLEHPHSAVRLLHTLPIYPCVLILAVLTPFVGSAILNSYYLETYLLFFFSLLIVFLQVSCSVVFPSVFEASPASS